MGISDLPKEMESTITQLLEKYDDIDNVVVLVNYNKLLSSADLPTCFVDGRSAGVEDLTRFHAMCLQGAHGINGITIKYLSGTTEDEKEEKNDS
jgi:hypothetical protein